MHHPKLIEVLKTLHPEQMERLRDFIHSPYFNKNQSVAAFFDYLKSIHPDYKREAITNEAIFKNVASVKGEGDLSNKMTRLFDLTGKFLSLEYSFDPLLEQIGTLKAYKKLHLQKKFESLARQLQKELKKVSFRDIDHLWRVHKLEEELFEGFDKGLQRTPDNSLDKAMKTLVRFYLTKKLYYLSEAVYRERLLGKTIGDDFKKEALCFLDTSKMDKDIYLTLYGNIFKMNMEKLPERALPHYSKIKTTLKTSAGTIPLEEVRSVSVYLQNFCLNQINKGSNGYLREFFEIIQFRISKGILLTTDRINPQLFKNIVSASIKLNELSWTDSFIREFSKNLPEEFSSDYVNLAWGQLYYQKKEYPRASRHLALASHNRNDIYFGFAVKKLLLKIGFESNVLVLDSYLEMYKKHLSRHHKKIGENAFILEKFYKYCRILAKSEGVEEIEILQSKLLAEENFADKDWLIAMTGKKAKRKLFSSTEESSGDIYRFRVEAH